MAYRRPSPPVHHERTYTDGESPLLLVPAHNSDRSIAFVNQPNVKASCRFEKTAINFGDNSDCFDDSDSLEFFSCKGSNHSGSWDDEEDAKNAIKKLELIQNGEYIRLCLQTPVEDGSYTKGVLLIRKDGLHYSFRNEYKRDHEDGRLEFHNHETLAKQRGAVTFLIKKIGAALFSGKSIMSISLPVDLFEPRSILERNAALMGFAPLFLNKVAVGASPLDQMKACVAFLTSMLHFAVEQRKPFNPILGETYQGFIDGCPVYYEQISHHPPVFAWQYPVKGLYSIEGALEMEASTTPNTLRGMMIGLEKVVFPNTKNFIYIRTPTATMEGITFGKRYINYSSKTVLMDPVNRLYAIVVFDPDRKTGMFTKRLHRRDHFEGAIYEMPKEFIDRKLAELKTNKKGYKLKARKGDFPPKPLSSFYGSWLEYLMIDKQEYWNINRIKPYRLVNAKSPLPSDSTYRLDSLYLRKGDCPKAQEVKEQMEEAQRLDKKGRKAPGKH